VAAPPLRLSPHPNFDRVRSLAGHMFIDFYHILESCVSSVERGNIARIVPVSKVRYMADHMKGKSKCYGPTIFGFIKVTVTAAVSHL